MNRVGSALAALAGVIGLGALVWWLRPKPAPEPTVERDKELDHHGQKGLYDKILETATASIDRSKSAATFVQGAAAAVATLYTGALSLVFVAGDNPLPVRGLAPTLFLAGSVGLASFYIAFITKGEAIRSPKYHPNNDSATRLAIQIQKYLEWTGSAIHSRRAFMQGAVLSLLFGVLLLPLAFVTVPSAWVKPLTGEAAPAPADVDTQAVLEVPEPQFDAPVELAVIAYQARIDDYLKATAPPEPATTAATNALAAWLTAVGAIVVVLVMLITAARDALERKALRDRRSG